MVESGVVVADTERERADALAVRHAVFVEGQGIAEDRELDGLDDGAVHVVAYDDGNPIGAARLREPETGTGKVERVAVREDRRGEGWGRRVMATVHTAARERGLTRLVLHAQTEVEGFYRGLGYRTVSDEFEEAGIPHVEMVRALD
ncbi:GNAT family N-acetyltransferase [Halorientalis regularis]|jgi:predicted GNAT family N-acyltransferase|uniref:Predicted N-acyltransferase, GNAT family n=1 Tax=Halorientalis regularis TaxID=660518 RepID=A0A1G7P8V6_9EURY|nr:GNAT family N-acetyltransferase [Halorientalis regularis]SDF82703.1 Predicted N-acyltransferase, GNAT family [Halorientalis regularis]